MDIKELIKNMRFQMDMLGSNYMSSSITFKDGCTVTISILNDPDHNEQEEIEE
jgi:hypothetical protein